MAKKPYLFAVSLAPNVQTDVTDGGVPVEKAGTYSLNLCNDGDVDATVTAIWLTDGVSPAARHKIEPRRTLKARRPASIAPIVLGEGWKLFVQSTVAISAQLVGKEG